MFIIFFIHITDCDLQRPEAVLPELCHGTRLRSCDCTVVRSDCASVPVRSSGQFFRHLLVKPLVVFVAARNEVETVKMRMDATLRWCWRWHHCGRCVGADPLDYTPDSVNLD
jgi:hypothetical protein